MVLRALATTGPARIQVELTIESEGNMRFSVLRDMEVGPPDLNIELTASVNDENQLVVRQEIINNGSQRFNLICFLFAQGRKYERTRVIVGPANA